MATFNYSVIYKHKMCTRGLFTEVINAIEDARATNGLELTDDHHPHFERAYRYVVTDKFSMPIGFKVHHGKLRGTESVQVQLVGRENDILSVKSDLVERVEGLRFE